MVSSLLIIYDIIFTYASHDDHRDRPTIGRRSADTQPRVRLGQISVFLANAYMTNEQFPCGLESYVQR